MNSEERYYNLLVKYKGRIEKATPAEMQEAVKGTPEDRTPTLMFMAAKERYQRELGLVSLQKNKV